ncbi:hypothetical protein [Brevundimonas sp.]|uniref:hypothetical protein n=1 Tax=Brevundimonas sp. TaxID=1871086 RepID=UPI0035B3979F
MSADPDLLSRQAYAEYRRRGSFVALMLSSSLLSWPEGEALPQIGGPLRSNDDAERDRFMASILADMSEILPDDTGLRGRLQLAQAVAGLPNGHEVLETARIAFTVGMSSGAMPAEYQARAHVAERDQALSTANLQRAGDAADRYADLADFANERRQKDPTIFASEIAIAYVKARQRAEVTVSGVAATLKVLRALVASNRVLPRAKKMEGGTAVQLFDPSDS